MHVRKLVYLFTRNSEQLDLHFSDFPMIYNRIYKFTGFGNKKKRKKDFAPRSLEVLQSKQSGPSSDREQGRRGQLDFGELGRRR